MAELETDQTPEVDSDGNVVEPDPATDTHVSADSGKAPQAPKELREYAQRVEAENAKLRAKAMKSELAELGLSPDQGLGVAIVESYSGEIDAAAIAAFAQEKYKYTPEHAPTPPAVISSERLDGLSTDAESVTPAQDVDEAAQITAKMNDPDAGRDDARASLAAKVDQFARENYG